jgi:hypothetical protein
MFPSGNSVRQTSKFDENVPVWEPLSASVGVGTIWFPDRNIDFVGESPLPPARGTIPQPFCFPLIVSANTGRRSALKELPMADGYDTAIYNQAIRTRIGAALRSMYDSEVSQPVPHRLFTLLIDLNKRPEVKEIKSNSPRGNNGAG